MAARTDVLERSRTNAGLDARKAALAQRRAVVDAAFEEALTAMCQLDEAARKDLLKKLLLDYARKQKLVTGTIFLAKNGKPLDRKSIWARMKRLCEAAGVAPGKVFPHNLRKLFARTFYGIEKDIAKLADILGHSSIDTTRIYIMTTGSEHRRKLERLGLVQ